MAKMSEYPHGMFNWIDIATTDPDAAKEFYSELFGWSYHDNPAGPDMVYSICQIDGEPVAGLSGMMPEMEQQGVPPHWTSYIAVENVDECMERAKKLKGNILMGPYDAVEAGRMAFIQDPGGAPFAIWQANNHIGAHIVNEPGTLTWNELYSNDTAASEKFYTELFGWGSQTNDMGSGFMYTSFMLGDRPNGGMMKIQPDWGEVPAHWGIYFAVTDCDETVEKVEALGGKLIMGPREIPEVGRMALVQDPQGAHFNVIKTAFEPL